MKKKSIKINTIYYMVYNILNVIFPFMTGIYVARVLVPEVVGQINYAQNIVQYFVLFSFLGLPTYGMREISKVRNDKEKLDKLYSELFIINFVSTSICLIFYLILIFSIEKFRNDIILYLIMGVLLFINYFNISWLYDGLEEFKFTSVRNCVFKILSFVMLVLLVKNKSDYLIYALIIVIGTSGNSVINMIYSRKFISFTLKGLSFKRHIKPIALLVAVNLAIEIYALVDTTMLGIIKGNESVAFYQYSTKIYKILIQIINSFTMVIVPRLALLYKENQLKEFNGLLTKTLKIIIMFALPMIIGILFTANDLVFVLYGIEYMNSAGVLKILSFMLIISPIGYLLGSRVLLTTNHENKMIISVAIGAVVNILCNMFMIPLYAEFGAAIASVFSEIVVMCIYVYLGKKYYKLFSIKHSIYKIIVSTIIIAALLTLLNYLSINVIVKIILEIVISITFYFCSLFFLHEESATEVLGSILKKINISTKKL